MGEAMLGILIYMVVGYWLARYRYGKKSTIERLGAATMHPLIEAFGLLMVALSYVFDFFLCWGKPADKSGRGQQGA